jgi:hypothetical protein
VLRLSHVQQSAQAIVGAGILVKLFPVLRKDTRSVGDPNETLWIVASPDATNWTPSKLEDVHKANAKANASHAGKAGSTSKPKVKAKISGGKTERQKEQRPLAKGEKDVAEQPVQEGHSESDDTSDEQEDEEEGEEEGEEEEAEEDDAGKDDAEGDVAGEDIEEDPNDSEGEEDLDEDEEAVVNDENEHDTEEQDDGEHNKSSEEAEAEEADKREDEEHEGEEDLAGEGEGEGSQTRGKDAADEDEKEEEFEYGEKAEEERITGEEDASRKEGRKRPLERSKAFECSTPKEHPNKRRKSDKGESEDGTATDDSLKRAVSPEKTPRPRASSPTSTTASPGSTRAVVRQTSVVPGLQDTESAVWDAAKRDSVISSLSLEQQTKMVLTALSLGSEEGIEELRHFVCNLRKNSKRGSDSLTSNSNLIAPNPDLRAPFASNDLVAQSDCLSHLSVLYRRLDVLESQETLFTITKRANLAAMAQYRENLVPKGAGRNQARDANLKLFRAIFPDHSTVERPEDKVTYPTASQDWFRLRNRLNEGRAWLEVRDLFGGNGAFLALPPQCVPDSYVSRITAKNFGPLLGLLDVAWRALDDGARRTMNALVRLALTGQPLPEAALALERPEAGILAASAGLSPMLAGWSEFDGTTRRSGDPATAHLTEQNVEDEINTQEVVRTTTAATSGKEVVADVEPSMQKGTMLVVDDGLLENIDFEEPLSQQI